MFFFVHRLLAPLKGEIRLLHLLPKEDHVSVEEPQNEGHEDANPLGSSECVRYAVSHVSLDNALAYTALPYNWGYASRKRAIVVDGAICAVTENLEAALRHLRLQDKRLTLWVDALCINQSDEVEKSEQMQQMRQVYSQATSVVAWLGPTADQSDLAMHWIEQFEGRFLELGIGTKPEMQLVRLLMKVET